MAKSPGQLDMDRAITDRIERFANALSSAVYARSQSDLTPVMTEVDELLTKACILERLVFAVHVLKTAGVPRAVIDRLLADNFLVARMLTQAGYGLDDERTIRLLATRDEAFQLDVASHDGISERITDYLVEIGGPEVAYRNSRAKLSPASVVALVERSQQDHRLLQALANRRDLDNTCKSSKDPSASAGSMPDAHGASAAEKATVKSARGVLQRSKFIKHT
jgi:hypothetical protein